MQHLQHHPAPRSSPDRRRTMAIAALAAVALVCLAAAPGRAAEGLYLTWNDCYLGAAATSNQSFACNTNIGQDDLYCAFTMPQEADNVIGVEIIVDLQHAVSPLPDWWRLDPQGPGCRQGNISASPDPAGRTACRNLWQGTAAFAQVQGYIPSEPRGADSQARIKVAAGVLPAEAVSVNAIDSYYAARIILRRGKTVGDPACAGCSAPACLVLNSILVVRGPAAGGDYFLQIPGAGAANWALWQGGAGADCAAVPVRNRAWGQLKSQYR